MGGLSSTMAGSTLPSHLWRAMAVQPCPAIYRRENANPEWYDYCTTSGKGKDEMVTSLMESGLSDEAIIELFVRLCSGVQEAATIDLAAGLAQLLTHSGLPALHWLALLGSENDIVRLLRKVAASPHKLDTKIKSTETATEGTVLNVASRKGYSAVIHALLTLPLETGAAAWCTSKWVRSAALPGDSSMLLHIPSFRAHRWELTPHIPDYEGYKELPPHVLESQRQRE